MAEAVIARAFLLVGQDRVCLAAFLELFLRVGIVRIAVGMVLQRQFAISALDLDIGRGATDTEYLVVIAFSVCRGNSSPLLPY